MKKIGIFKKCLLLGVSVTLAITSIIAFRYIAEVYSWIYIMCAIILMLAYPFSLWYPNNKH